MLTSGREFSIEQLKINLVGGPLQSYNFLECKTFFSILIKTNLPSLLIPSPPAASLLFIGCLAQVRRDTENQGSSCAHGAYIYMMLMASPRPHYPLRTPRDSVVPSLYVDSSSDLTQNGVLPECYVQSWLSHGCLYPMEEDVDNLIPSLLLGVKTRSLQSGENISLKPLRTSREIPFATSHDIMSGQY